MERRKRPRNEGKGSSASKASAGKSRAPKSAKPSSEKSEARRAARIETDVEVSSEERCRHCNARLESEDRALFVEEEVGRVFCSEDCISAYFTPEIERLEKEYYRRLAPGDLSATEREELAHLRWITLQEADEVWREKTLSGDYRYTLISEFDPGKKVWCVCICLFLRGEPSFLFLAFVTRNAAMVDQYRRGEPIEWIRQAQGMRASGASSKEQGGDESDQEEAAVLSDRLADPWTEEETYRAQLYRQRDPKDISPEDFHLYQHCIEKTLEAPDEVWSTEAQEAALGEEENEVTAESFESSDSPDLPESVEVKESSGEALKIYHFIRHYDDQSGFWYVIVARDVADEEQIELLEAFPTRDPELVDRLRRGTREVGSGEPQASSSTRVVH